MSSVVHVQRQKFNCSSWTDQNRQLKLHAVIVWAVTFTAKYNGSEILTVNDAKPRRLHYQSRNFTAFFGSEYFSFLVIFFLILSHDAIKALYLRTAVLQCCHYCPSLSWTTKHNTVQDHFMVTQAKVVCTNASSIDTDTGHGAWIWQTQTYRALQ